MEKWLTTWQNFAVVVVMFVVGCGSETNKGVAMPPSECEKTSEVVTYSAPLPPNSITVAEFVQDEEHFYFTERGTWQASGYNNDGRIFKQSLDTGDPVVLANGEILPLHITLDAANIYWTTETDIRKMSLSGGTPLTIASGFGVPQSIAVAGNYVFWTTNSAKLLRASIDGTDVATLVDDSATSFAYAGLAVDAKHLYWANRGTVAGNDGSILKMPIDGGPVTTLVTGQSNPSQVVVDPTHVYWTNTGDFQLNVGLMKVPVLGGPAETVVSSQSNTFAQYAEMGGVFVNSDALYYSVKGSKENDHYDGTVIRRPLSGGEPTILASAMHFVGVSLAVRGCHVYFEANGHLHRANLP